jgi:para-nitrobenzyl esterase
LHAAHSRAVSALGADDYRPVIDGRHIPYGPLTPEGVAIHAAVPMMIGTTETETTLWLGRDRRNVTASAEQVTDRIARQFGMDVDKAADIYATYEREVQGRTPYDVVSALSTDLVFRARMLGGVEAKAAARKAPVFLYNFNWQIPVDGGIWKSPHTVDIPFAFANVDRVRVMTGNDKNAQRVSRRFMSSFVAFARTGNPGNRLMPQWPMYETASRSTMVVGNICKTVDDYLGSSRKVAQPLLVQQAYQIQAGPLMRLPS